MPGALCLVCGGCPRLKPLCVASSLPADFEARLHEISLSGNRVLAAAHRPLPDLTLAEVSILAGPTGLSLPAPASPNPACVRTHPNHHPGFMWVVCHGLTWLGPCDGGRP